VKSFEGKNDKGRLKIKLSASCTKTTRRTVPHHAEGKLKRHETKNGNGSAREITERFSGVSIWDPSSVSECNRGERQVSYGASGLL